MSAKRGWSTYWLLLFTFVTPCKVVCHACFIYIYLIEQEPDSCFPDYRDSS